MAELPEHGHHLSPMNRSMIHDMEQRLPARTGDYFASKISIREILLDPFISKIGNRLFELLEE